MNILCNPVEKKINLNGVEIRYFVAIPKVIDFDVVLLHGMSFSADTWLEIGTVSVLCEVGFRVFAIDMPGFGKSGGKRLKRSFASEFLHRILREIGALNPVLVGPSMGGGIALLYAIRFDELRGLVLIAPAGLNDPSIVDNLDKISNLPTLIFWGDKDRVFPLSMSEILAGKLVNSKIVVCKNAPHPCYLEATEVFHEELLVFLNSI